MTPLEQFVFDGIDLNAPPNGFILQGVELAPPPKRIEFAQSADADGATLVRDPLFDTRDMTLRLRVGKQPTMDDALNMISTLAKKLEECEKAAGGLPITWTPADSTTTSYIYVLTGSIDGIPVELTGDDAGWFLKAPVVTVKLTCKPALYGADVTYGPFTSSTPYVEGTLTAVPGDLPGEARLQVTDTASQNRSYLEWGLEQRFFNPLTEVLARSTQLITSGYSGALIASGAAYTSNVVRGTLTPAVGTVCATAGTLAHVGTFRVKAHVLAGAATEYMRLSWQEGDGPYRTNAYTAAPVAGTFSEVDLGLITVAPTQLGTQRWQGRIEGYTTSGTATLDIDYLEFIPAQEGYGRARPDGTPVIYSGRTAEVRFDGAYRQDSTGTYYGRLAHRGSPFFVPAAGDQNRDSHVVVKAHRNDIETASSVNVTDALSVSVVVTPRYLVPPA